MKKILLVSFAIGAVVLTANAQTDRMTKPDSGHMGNRPPMDGRMREQNEEMMKDLNLTDAQKVQMKKNNEDMRTKMDAIRSNTSLSQDDKRTQMKALRDQQKSQMDALLTPDQKAKWDAQRQKMMEERRQNGGENNGNRPTAPTPPTIPDNNNKPQ